jgi:2-phosphoglycerate kinase
MKFRSLMKSSTMRMAPFSRALSVVPAAGAGLTGCCCSTDPSRMLWAGVERYLQQINKNTVQIEDLAKIVTQIQSTQDSDKKYKIRQASVRASDEGIIIGILTGVGLSAFFSIFWNARRY